MSIEMGTDETAFRCPVCEETIVVNPPMQDALEKHGCPVCGADVSADNFVRAPAH